MQSQQEKSTQEKKLLQVPLQQVIMMHELYSFRQSLPFSSKTIILYDIYQTETDDKLNNLPIFAKLLIDDTLPVTVNQRRKGKKYWYQYQLQKENHQNIFERECPIQLYPKESSKQNPKIYESSDQQLRVVMLPLSTEMMDFQKVNQFFEKVDLEDKSSKQKIKEDGCQNDELKRRYKEVDYQLNQKIERFSKTFEENRFKKLFKLQALIRIFQQKTEEISVNYLLEAESKHYELALDQSTYKHRNPKKPEFDFRTIFSSSKHNCFPLNYVVHSFMIDEESKPTKQINNSYFTALFCISTNNELVTQKNSSKESNNYIQCNKQKLKEEQRIPIISLTTLSDSKEGKNVAITQIIKDFGQFWKQTILKSSLCFMNTVSTIDTFFEEKNLYKKAHSFSDIKQEYKLNQFNFKTQSTLGQFFSSQRRRQSIDLQPEEPLIPLSIKHLVFSYFYQRILNSFLDRYGDRERKVKNDQTLMIKYWKSLIKQILELVISFDQTLQRSQIQRHFNFIQFLLKSSYIIKSITNVESGIGNALKSHILKSCSKKHRILEWIVDHEESLEKQASINYYNLLLLITQQTKSSEVQKQINYIRCYLMELKAYQIACKYIENQSKIVEAIKSYAHICCEYPSLNLQKRKMINIASIQKKMARLLRIIGQEEIAVQIYFKNRMLSTADQTCTITAMKYKGDKKTEKLIEWGQKFQKELQYELAMSYYRKAYECVESVEWAKKAIQHKVNCNNQRRKQETQEIMKDFNNFLKTETQSMEQFTSCIKLDHLYYKIKSQLVWDKENEESVFRVQSEKESGANTSECSKQESEKKL